MTAHVDSGKTTLAEAMLYRAGEIRKLGRVDHGNAFLDTNHLEKSRGITIFSKQAVLRTENAEFTLLDTPGHVDFAAEAERALTAVDIAVLVISATDGVQSHTETLWRILRRYDIPAFIFVNKMDIAQENGGILDELRKRLSTGCVDFTPASDIPETAAELDENCMESFLETGEVPDGLISKTISERRIFPVLFGSALKLKGIDELLAALERYAEEPERSTEFAARVYKITRDENGTRLTHLKINGGFAAVTTAIDQNAPDEKINQIRI